MSRRTHAEHVANNVADLTGGELRFPEIRVVRPLEFMKEAIR